MFPFVRLLQRGFEDNAIASKENEEDSGLYALSRFLLIIDEGAGSVWLLQLLLPCEDQVELIS